MPVFCKVRRDKMVTGCGRMVNTRCLGFRRGRNRGSPWNMFIVAPMARVFQEILVLCGIFSTACACCDVEISMVVVGMAMFQVKSSNGVQQ